MAIKTSTKTVISTCLCNESTEPAEKPARSTIVVTNGFANIEFPYIPINMPISSEEEEDVPTITVSLTSTTTLIKIVTTPPAKKSTPTTSSKITITESSDSTSPASSSLVTTNKTTSLNPTSTAASTESIPTASETEASSVPNGSGGKSAWSGGRIAGLLFGIALIVALIGGTVFYFRRTKKKNKPVTPETSGGNGNSSGGFETEGRITEGEAVPAPIPLGPIRRRETAESRSDVRSDARSDVRSDEGAWDHPYTPLQPDPRSPARSNLLAPTATSPRSLQQRYEPWSNSAPYQNQSNNPYQYANPERRADDRSTAELESSSPAPSHMNDTGPSGTTSRSSVPVAGPSSAYDTSATYRRPVASPNRRRDQQNVTDLQDGLRIYT